MIIPETVHSASPTNGHLDTFSLSILDYLEYAERCQHFFYCSICIDCTITLCPDYSVHIDFWGGQDKNVLLQDDLDMKDTGNYSIGEAFDACFHNLVDYCSNLPEPTKPEVNDDISIVLELVRYLENAAYLLDDAKGVPQDLIEKAIYRSLLDEYRPLYGQRILSDSVCKYRCKNLLQMCAALLDILCHISIKEEHRTVSHKISLRVCPRCGRYFTTTNRKSRYCPYQNDMGKDCADLQTIVNKERYILRQKSKIQQLETYIKDRLRSYFNNEMYLCRSTDTEYQYRKNLLDMFTSLADLHRRDATYYTWLLSCKSLLPTKHSESYEKFYAFLSTETF